MNGVPVDVDTDIAIVYSMSGLLPYLTGEKPVYAPDEPLTASSGIARTDLPPQIQVCGSIRANKYEDNGCQFWDLDGVSAYRHPSPDGTFDHLAVQSFDGKAIRFTHQGSNDLCEGRVTDDGVAYATLTNGTDTNKCLPWTIALLYPTTTPPVNFLLGSWQGPQQPDRYMTIPGNPLMTTQPTQTRVKMPGVVGARIIFTSTELTLSAPTIPGQPPQSAHFAVTYKPLTARLTEFKVANNGQDTVERCRLLSTGKAICTEGLVSLDGLIHTK